MLFEYRYQGGTAVDSRPDRTAMSFAPDTSRDPVYFRAALRKGLPFREAISALHDVVVSDLRYKPKDRAAYKAWLATQEERELEQLAGQTEQVRGEIESLRTELAELDKNSRARGAPFYRARQRYFDYLYKRDYDAWFVLDPVITVHPDEVFFECFSQDESSYGRLSVGHDVFQQVGEMAHGTTNIDYSAALYGEFQKIRSYKTTELQVDPSGFEVETRDATAMDESYKEVKIDLPDSWVRGFLQVSSAMSLPMTSFDLHPMDIHNFCFILRRHKEIRGPRSIRYVLEPGEPVRAIFEPWGTEVVCRRSPYQSNEAQEIRVWGRRRLHQLERLIPVANKFTVHLLGTGMPSFYIADMGDMWFTLGLSGWTANDWSRAGNLDLMAPRADVDAGTAQTVFNSLCSERLATTDALAQKLGLDRAMVLGALGTFTQAGRAIYDLNKGVFRMRELSQEPLPLGKLRFANEREQSANRFLDAGAVELGSATLDGEGNLSLEGQVREQRKTYAVSMTIDQDERLARAECSCRWHKENKLFKGPCEHILAIRLQHGRKTRR